MLNNWLTIATKIADLYEGLGKSRKDAELIGLALSDALIGNSLEKEMKSLIINRTQLLPEQAFQVFYY